MNVLNSLPYLFAGKVEWENCYSYRLCILTHYGPATEKFILEDLFSSVLSHFKKYHPSGNLKFNNLGKISYFKGKILPISLKLNFTPTTLGCYGLIFIGISITIAMKIPRRNTSIYMIIDTSLKITFRPFPFFPYTKQTEVCNDMKQGFVLAVNFSAKYFIWSHFSVSFIRSGAVTVNLSFPFFFVFNK